MNCVRNIFAARLAGAMVIAACAVFVATSNRAFADNARDYVEPRLTRQQFTTFTKQIELASDQRSFAELMFSDYTAALDELTADLETKAQAAGLKNVQDALAGRARISPDELRAKRVEILTIYQQGWEVIDQELDNLIASVRTLLNDSQAAHVGEALRDLHRSLYLHSRQADREFHEYAGDGVDVLQLADDAMKDGGELRSLGYASIESILASYEQQLDDVLVQSAAEHRNAKLLRKIATIEKNEASLRQLTLQAVARWKQLYQLNERTVQQIAHVANQTLGNEASQRWLDRFDHACFTWLFPRRKPDRQIEWIRKQALEGDTIEKAESIYSSYADRRRELSRQAIDIMLRARLEHQAILYANMDAQILDNQMREGLWKQLLKNSGELTNLETTASNALEALLTSAQRDGLRKAMQGPDRGR